MGDKFGRSRYRLQGEEGTLQACGIVPDCYKTRNRQKIIKQHSVAVRRGRQTTVRVRQVDRQTGPQREGQVTVVWGHGTNPWPLLKPLCFACKHCWPYNTQWTASAPVGPVKTCFDCPVTNDQKKKKETLCQVWALSSEGYLLETAL